MLIAALLVTGFAAAQSLPTRGRFSSGGGLSLASVITQISTTSGWTSNGTTTSTALNSTLAAGVGTAANLTVGNSSDNPGGTILSYANPDTINAIEFRVPGSSTLHGYFYADSTKGTLITGKIQSEHAAVKGSKTLAAGTGTVTVLSGAKCVCTNETTALAATCPVSGTTLTITSGVGTDTVSYVCL